MSKSGNYTEKDVLEYKDIEENSTVTAIKKVLRKYFDPTMPIDEITEEIIKALDEAYDEEIKRIFDE